MYKIIGANNAEYGPVTADQLRQWITEGRVNADTLAQADGETDWKPISSYAEFAASFPSAQAAPPPPPGVKSPPTFHSGAADLGGRDTALNEVSGPGIAMIVVGALGIAYGGLGVVSHLFRSALGGFNGMNNFGGQNPQMNQFILISQGPLGLVLALLHAAIGAFIIYAGLRMKALEQYGLCMVASILAVIPCLSPCCCVGIPIGIWALVVLNKSEVKAHFS